MAIGWQVLRPLRHVCVCVIVCVYAVHEYKTLFLFIPFSTPNRLPLCSATRRAQPAAAVGLCPFERPRRVSPCRSAHIKQNLLENISFSFSLPRSRFYSHFLSLSFFFPFFACHPQHAAAGFDCDSNSSC